MAPACNETSVITFQLQTEGLRISFHLDLTQSVWAPFKCHHFTSHSESTSLCVCVFAVQHKSNLSAEGKHGDKR